ncbi:LysM peptidoglycan-binding domain-containing protein [Apibacter muscae]|uniref:LysM peptidoglycan-binding domain-containing protein n=1 Tax=Apibacter muscae TaxID=2509004 RepID=A0A563DGH3_9FLAO|nr:LysM peptidoglycan-binding domain-containing protein [Apibacter muscae]TWP29260.1 LysM peptidoglycan-binding domain-containing protein [Apibacter muscae]
MPEYILHKVKKGDTVWGISRQYGVEEHKIVQANPEIKLRKQGKNYTPLIYEGDTLRIPQGEGKENYRIEGKTSLGMGETATYKLVTSEGIAPHYPAKKIIWLFFVDEGTENWRQLRLEKEKTGQEFSIVFKNQKLKAKKIRMEAYVQWSKEREKLAEFFMALDGQDVPEIKELTLLDANRNKIKRKVSYSETIFARALCTGMEGETLYFSLWEDDAKGAGHSEENKDNFIETKTAIVTDGKAEVAFRLLYATMAPIANRKVPVGQKNEGAYHEYYVTATRYEKTEGEKASENIDVKNPDYTPPPPKPKPKPKATPKKETTKPKIIHKAPVNAPAKGRDKLPAPAWKEPNIIRVYIRDTQGKVWNRNPKYGEKIRVYIDSENMINRKIQLKIYDKDVVYNDLLHEEDRTITANTNFGTIHLTAAMQEKGGDISYQNLFAEVYLYDTQQTVKSEVVNVDKTNFSALPPEGITPTTVASSPQKKEENKNKCVCEERVRAYMRMLRVGEGTGELIKSYDQKLKKIVYIEKDPQKGYTTAFGGNKILDLSKHPEKNYGGSTAAGAYQIMRYTWWSLSGWELDKNYAKTGKYIEKNDLLKKYNITDYYPESQDKICVIIFKHKRSGILNLITKGEIERATREYGSLEWASLPNKGDNSKYSYKGKPQPATPMKDVLAHFEEFYKEELNEISNLHLKKGFLKSFNHTCNCQNKDVTIIENKNNICNTCNEEHYNLADGSKWQTQFDSIFGNKQKQNVACWRACKVILSNYGVTGGDNINPIQMVSQNGTSDLILKKVKEGKSYLDKELKSNRVVLVGVDDGRTAVYNSDKTTEHFIVIIGKGCDNGKIFYRYFDVGTAHKDKGTNSNNKLYLQSNGIIQGKSPGGTKTYTIAQVRKNTIKN